jgi:hypothetical protein
LSSSTHYTELSWWVWESTSLEDHYFGDWDDGGLMVMEAVCNCYNTTTHLSPSESWTVSQQWPAAIDLGDL